MRMRLLLLLVVLQVVCGAAHAVVRVRFHEDADRDFEIDETSLDQDERMVLTLDPFLIRVTPSPTLPPSAPPTAFPTSPLRLRKTTPSARPSSPASPPPSAPAASLAYSQTQLDMMRVPADPRARAGVSVFVLDTGCDGTRFAGMNVEFGPSFVATEPTSDEDLNGHGTHVAGFDRGRRSARENRVRQNL